MAGGAQSFCSENDPGALDYAAERLGVSKVTLYSDLDLLRRESESAGSSGSGRQKK